MKKIFLLFICFIVISFMFTSSTLAVSLISPANGATVTRNTAGGWYPYLSWQGDGMSFCYFFEIATSPQTNYGGGFNANNIVISKNYVMKTYYNSSQEYPYWYLYPGTYYWHVSDFSWGGELRAWSAIRSFTVPQGSSGQVVLNPSKRSLYYSMTKGGSNPPSQKIDFNPNQQNYWWWSQVPQVGWVVERQITNTNVCYYDIYGSNLAVGKYVFNMAVWGCTDNTYSTHVTGSPMVIPITLEVKSSSGTLTSKTRTAISFYTSRTTINKGSRVKYYGYLRDSKGRGIPSRKVYLRYLSGSAWRTLKTLITNTKGYYSYYYRPGRTRYWRTSYLGNSITYPCSSRRIKVTVR